MELNNWFYLGIMLPFKPYLISIYTIFEQLLKRRSLWAYFALYIFNMF